MMGKGFKGKGKGKGGQHKTDAPSSSSSAFTLAGLLNVLDGVVDSPGRILVMTSNHPEKLDPALIRPGRISKRIHLGGMTAESMVGMVEHYHATTLTEAQKAELRDIAGLTPARVEQCCAEADSFEALVRLLSSD